MAPISHEEKENKKRAESFNESFNTLFSNDTLLEIYNKEKKAYNDNIHKINSELLNDFYQKEKAYEMNKNDKNTERPVKPKLELYFDEQYKVFVQKLDPDENDFLTLFSHTIEYVKKNIFHSSNGEYYVLSYNKESGYYPKEYTKETITTVYIKYFPTAVKYWFDNMYYKVFSVSIEQNKPRIYNENGINFLNLFNGYPDDGVERDEKLMIKYKDSITLYLNHIKNVLCNSDELVFNEVINWIYALIGGRRKLNTSIYIKGAMGIGKGVLVDLITKILGRQNCIRIQKAAEILGQFNGHLAGKLFVYIDDVSLTDSEFKTLYETLKPIVTENTNTYRDLFKKAVTLTNLNSIFITCNRDMLKFDSHNSGQDRRFVCCDPAGRREDSYFTPLWALNDDENFRRCFLWHCQEMYDPKWNEQINIKKLPLTNTAKQMILHSIPPLVEYLKVILEQVNIEEQRLPKTEYMSFCEYYKTCPTLDIKRIPKYQTFCNDITKFKAVTIKTERYRGPNKDQYSSNPTCYLTIDKEELIKEFRAKGFFSKYDTIDGKEVLELTKEEEIKETIKKRDEALIEYKRLDKLVWEQRLNELKEHEKKRNKFKEEMLKTFKYNKLDVSLLNIKYVRKMADDFKKDQSIKQNLDTKTIQKNLTKNLKVKEEKTTLVKTTYTIKTEEYEKDNFQISFD